MSKRNQYSPNFRYRVLEEVKDYQKVHNSKVCSAVKVIAEKYGINIHTINKWMYSSNRSNIQQSTTPCVAAMAVATKEFNVKEFFNNLSPFKRALACMIGLHKHIKQ